MGRSYWFECPRCGYRAKISDIDLDRPFPLEKPKSGEPGELATEAALKWNNYLYPAGGPDYGLTETGIRDTANMIQQAIDQACAEKDQQLFDSDNQVKMLCADWAEDDTAVKSLAAPYIGDFDAARPAEERGLGFRGVVEVTEALVAKLAESNAEIARLNKGADEADQEHGSLIAYIEEKLPVPGAHGTSEHISWAADEIARLKERIDEMTGLLESSGHRHWQQNVMHDPAGNCRSGCSRCIWEAMKAKP